MCSVSSLRHRQSLGRFLCWVCPFLRLLHQHQCCCTSCSSTQSVKLIGTKRERIIQLWSSVNTCDLTGHKQGHVNLQAWMLLWLFKIFLGEDSWHFFSYFKHNLPLLALRPQLCFLLHSFFFSFYALSLPQVIQTGEFTEHIWFRFQILRDLKSEKLFC